MSHPEAVVSPGGVGFDINCGAAAAAAAGACFAVVVPCASPPWPPACQHAPAEETACPCRRRAADPHKPDRARRAARAGAAGAGAALGGGQAGWRCWAARMLGRASAITSAPHAPCHPLLLLLLLRLPQALFDHIPVGVGSQGIIPTTAKDLEEALEMGMDWSLREVRGHLDLGAETGGIAGCGGAGRAQGRRHARPDVPTAACPPPWPNRHRATRGQRTRSIARSMAACSTPTHQR